MALTLLVDRSVWRARVEAFVTATPGLLPVVKGNGYGFGRARLLAECRTLGLAEVAVGTVHELGEIGPDQRPVVLTPCATAGEAAQLAARADTVATVGSARDLDLLPPATPVVVKLRTSMHRYGTTPGELPSLLELAIGRGNPLHAVAAHFPLAGTSADHAAELRAWQPHLPQGVTVHVSHVALEDLVGLRAHHVVRPRVGTALWHAGDKAGLRLVADVAAVHPVAAGERAGYRQLTAPADGHVVLVTAGTAHGVHPLAEGRSPFHFARTRLALLEPPHMHTSMLHVPAGDPCPEPGDRVDVQRPLTQTWVDAVEER